jgi:hypothetical protein
MTLDYNSHLDSADWFLEQAESGGPSHIVSRFSSAAVVFSFMALQSFINNMLFDFAAVPSGFFSVHEQGFLQEKSVVPQASGDRAGTFQVSNRDEFKRLEDKILFLVAKAAGHPFDKSTALWKGFGESKDVRDALTHPKQYASIGATPVQATKSIQTARALIKALAAEVWGDN